MLVESDLGLECAIFEVYMSAYKQRLLSSARRQTTWWNTVAVAILVYSCSVALFQASSLTFHACSKETRLQCLISAESLLVKASHLHSHPSGTAS